MIARYQDDERDLHEGDADETETTPYEEHFGAQVGMILVDHVGSRVRNRPVEQPVAGSGHTQALGSGLEREHLASDDPCNRAPRAGEEEDVDAHECYGGILRGSVDIVCVDRRIGMHTYATNNELADAHADRTHEQEVAAT